jgi:hypothetical protein
MLIATLYLIQKYWHVTWLLDLEWYRL